MKFLLLSAMLAAAPAAMAASDDRLGAEVESLCFSSQINRWSAVEGRDGAILLDRGANDWHFVEISEGCSEKLIRRANAIVTQGTPGSACLTVNDSVSVVDNSGFPHNCRIKRIYKWNAKGAPPDVGAAVKSEEDA